MQFLGCQQREPLTEIKSHLVSENAAGSGPGSVTAVNALSHYFVEQVEILFHDYSIFILFGISGDSVYNNRFRSRGADILTSPRSLCSGKHPQLVMARYSRKPASCLWHRPDSALNMHRSSHHRYRKYTMIGLHQQVLPGYGVFSDMVNGCNAPWDTGRHIACSHRYTMTDRSPLRDVVP